ncbi:CENPB DNA-binding domain-containing protein 1-like [Aedes aegypti]|uniref:Uncharacterized protein n=1 Tax=Aedes aegypti TaxID=7159 RepID=A0A6I8TVL0_AEDAE|nr:CENPB DNA-binding domain-containing protein 1-like [Aedes aegypti]
MNSTAKKVRKSLSLQMKLNILDCLAAGEKVSQVGRKFGLAFTTITTIRKQEANIRQAVVRGGDMGGSRTSYIRDPIIAGMEKQLLAWIDDNKQQGFKLSGDTIRFQALQIYNELQADEETSSQPKRKFHASSGWLVKFVKRYSLRNVGGVGEESAFADVSDSSTSHAQRPLEHIELMEVLVDPIGTSNNTNMNEKKPQEFNQEKLGELIKMAGKMVDLSLDEDLNTERAVKFRRDLNRLMGGYKDLYEKQSRQLSSDSGSSAEEEDVLSS